MFEALVNAPLLNVLKWRNSVHIGFPGEKSHLNGSAIKETLNKWIPLMPFDFAQESVRQIHYEWNQ